MTVKIRVLMFLAVFGLLAASCASDDESTAQDGDSAATESDTDDDSATGSETTSTTAEADEAAEQPPVTQPDFGDPPAVPDEFDNNLLTSIDTVFGDGLQSASFATTDREALQALEDSGDPRVAWLISDLLRFFSRDSGPLVTTAEGLTGLDLSDVSPWVDLTNHLIAWDIPAPPDYVEYKRSLFTLVVPEWEPFFEEQRTDIDYRFWSWGGVGIDNRLFDETDQPCQCIPAADNPEVTDAAGGDWYADDRIVFGVVINDEARAYPRNIMEIREMVNDTLGGRDIAMPYCTLCGSAQVYFTDTVPADVERPVLRTSGLLTRSNKVMYDVNTFSVFDTFLGEALTGPLADQGIVLDQASVVTTTWGEWKQEHPDTTILDQALTLGRESDLLNTRDAGGPIFPIGDVDERLPIQEPILGVLDADGTPIAFPVAEARSSLVEGTEVGFGDIVIELNGGGIRAVDGDGNDLAGHQAFWFAWSQFHPETEVWLP